MAQPVTVLSSFALGPKLGELSALASQIAHHSDELRATLQSNSLANSASACSFLHVALSNAQGCLSLLRSMNKAPIYPPFSPPSKPSVLGPRFPTPAPTAASIFPLPHPVYPPKGMIGTRLPDTPLDPPSLFHSHPNVSATQRWPVPPTSPSPTGATLDFAICPAPRGYSTNGYSPHPLPFHLTTARHGVTIGELVDEEDSSPDTRGGVSPSRPPARDVPPRAAINYPPLFITITDVTPRPTREPETTQAPAEIRPRPSSKGPSTPTPHRGRVVCKGRKAPCRRRRKAAPQAASEQRVTRSGTKRKATDEFQTSEAVFSKRAKPSPT